MNPPKMIPAQQRQLMKFRNGMPEMAPMMTPP
jgi:hypothetical protein